MSKEIDVKALSQEVKRDSQSGSLSRELLARGQTLYGRNPKYPNCIERITPDGKKSLGHLINGGFVEKIELSDKSEAGKV